MEETLEKGPVNMFVLICLFKRHASIEMCFI